MSSRSKMPFTGYFGMWSAVSKRFVFGIQERYPKKAHDMLWKKIGWDAAKYRFRAKRIRYCAEHREMFYQELKHMHKARSGKRTQNKTLKTNITQKGRDSSMNIKITVEAPGLVSAIESLALALSGAGFPVTLPSIEGAASTSISEDVANKEKERLAALQKADAEKVAAAQKAIEDVQKAAAEKAELDAATEKAKNATKEAATKEAASKDEAVEEKETVDPGISLEVVRGKLAAHSALGRPQQLQIQDAISRFGVQKLTDVNPEDYAELLELSGVTE